MAFDPTGTPVDHVILSGQRSPGIAEIVGASSPRRWDERRGYALSGSTVIFRGVGLARFKIVLRLYAPEHWSEWATWSQLVQRPPPLERARALDISHPILEDLGIRSCVIETVGQPVQSSQGGGEWTIEIACIEYRRPTPAIARPDGSDDRLPEPTDPADRALRALAGINTRAAAGEDVGFGEVTDALAGL
jgi:hypothetical protein